MKNPPPNDLWSDPGNWKYGLIYHCRADPRVIVPKRLRWTGYTVNFGHAAAWPALAAIVGAVLAPFGLAFVLPADQVAVGVGVAFVLAIVALIWVCHWESTRQRRP